MKKDPKKSLGSALKSEGKLASEWIKKTKEDMEVNSWLKKAKHFEGANDLKKALDAYLNFLELKLNVISSRPEYTVNDYLQLVPYYLKIADCYKKIRHFQKEDRLRDFTKSAEYYHKAAKMYLELKEYPSANVYFEFASNTYAEVELYVESADVYREIAEMYMTLDNRLIASSSFYHVGELYEKADDYDSAYNSYLRSAELSTSLGDMDSAAKTYRKAAEILRKQGRYDEAVKHYVDAAEIGSELEKYAEVAKTYLGVAENYEEAGDLDEAIRYYLKVIDVSMDNDDSLAAKALERIAKCYSEKHDFSESISYYERAGSLRSRLGEYSNAAQDYWTIAEIREMTNELEDAAEAYLLYSRYAASEQNSSVDMKGYSKAAGLFAQIAEQRYGKKDFFGAVSFYKKSAKSFDNLHNTNMAGEFYMKAGLLEKKEDLGDYFKTCLRAAEKYKEAELFRESARCFFEIREFLQAAREFTTFAGEELKKDNLFYSAEGFRMAGYCYEQLAQKGPMVDRYNKANQTYLKYIGKLKRMNVSSDGVSDVGEAYLGLAESNRVLGNTQKAKEYFKTAFDYFKKNKLKDKSNIAFAFFSFMDAKLALQKGNYPAAAKMLTKAIELFTESLVENTWDEHYLKFIEDQLNVAKGLLTEISEKPEVNLSMDAEVFSIVGRQVLINFILSNQGKQTVKKVSFLPHLPESVSVVKPPEPIDELGPGESVVGSIQVAPKSEGKSRSKLMEVIYQDGRGNKYVKSSNVVSLEFVQVPAVEYRTFRAAVDIYLSYAKNQLKNKNFFYAGEAFKEAAECFKQVSLKRSADLKTMQSYYKKSIDAYLKYVDSLKSGKGDIQTTRSIADTYFNIGDCYEAFDDFDNSHDYLGDARSAYSEVIEKSVSEKTKMVVRAQITVIDAFLSRIEAKNALRNKDSAKAAELLERSKMLFMQALEKGWGKEYEQFLKKNLKETEDLFSAQKVS